MDRRISWFDRVKGAAPAPGPLALAAFAICVVTGLPLLLVCRPDAPLESLALVLMKNPAVSWVRGVHFWSAQGLLVCFLWYLINQLATHGEARGGFGAWLRLVLAGPVILLALASGTILRGDALGNQTAALLADLLNSIPPAGRLLAFALLGSGPGSHVVWWHHGLTIPLLLALLLVARFRRLAPEARPFGWMLAGALAMSAFFAPGLNAYPASVSPWYLAALADLVRWIPEPGLAAGLALTALLALALLPLLGQPLRAAVKWGLAGALVACAFATAMGLVRRPPDPALAGGAAPRFLSFRSHLPVAAALRKTPVATIAGRPEGCLSCHRDMSGFAPAHQPAALGCSTCHLGNPFTLDARLAHAGMTLTPGNLSVVRTTCATAGCHADIAARIEASLMNTMSGVVAVDKVVFGESRNLDQSFVIARLGHSPADGHLRNLCASCHLGTDKLRPAAIGQESRGGGCSACHLSYGPAALDDLRLRNARPTSPPRHHPDISVNVAPTACFGCHSRSGRISTSYEGWHETLLDEPGARRSPGWPARYRVLDDGRVFAKERADVHFEKGLTCTDCHLAIEVMGDGAAHAHEADAVRIACTDCHADSPPSATTLDRLDPETQRIIALRHLDEAGRQFVRTRSGREAYPNVFLDHTGGIVQQVGKTGALLHPRPPASACRRDIPAHQKMECRTCHSAWAPQCITCHTSFDPKQEGWDHLAARSVRGVWEETPGDFRADPPTLGVETVKSDAGAAVDRIATFAPGMIMTLNKSTGGARLPDEFHRLYAPAVPHTIVAQARDCRSCHADSLALGYGRGALTYTVTDGKGRWTFAPAFARSPRDGLPLDAWIGFLEEPKTPAATRTNVRPFNRGEQQRMLLVGACLHCHSEKEPRVAAVFADFADCRSRLSPRCVLPDWTP